MSNKNCTLTDDGYLIPHTAKMYEWDRRYFYKEYPRRNPAPMNPVYWRRDDTCEVARCESPIQRRLGK